jgi:predicted site-specific integrase-resolvase
MPSLMNKQQLATFLGVSKGTVDVYRKLGLIKSLKVRGRVRFPRAYVLDFLWAHLEHPLT